MQKCPCWGRAFLTYGILLPLNLRRWNGVNGHFSFWGQVNWSAILTKYMHMPWRLRWGAVGVKPTLHLAAGIGPSLHKLKMREEKVKGGYVLLRGKAPKCGATEQAVLDYFPQLVSQKSLHTPGSKLKIPVLITSWYKWDPLLLLAMTCPSHDSPHWEFMSSVDLFVGYLSSYFCSWQHLNPMS